MPIDYIYHKSELEFVQIPAFLELPELGSPHVTFCKLLNESAASYENIILNVPKNVHPETYEAISGIVYFEADHLDSETTPPAMRLPCYETKTGRKYAFWDYWKNTNRYGEVGYDDDGNWIGKGRKIRVRCEIAKV